jgi:hypothetical protein
MKANHWERSQQPNDYMSRSLGSRTSFAPNRLYEDNTKSREEIPLTVQNPFPAQPQPLRTSYNDAAQAGFRDAGPIPAGPPGGYDPTRMPTQSGAPTPFLSRSLDAQSLLSQPLGGSMDRAGRSSGAEGEIEICKDELSRTKALLEQDKAVSMRYVKEIDVLQRKNADQVMQLQALLNQSEQARRDLEIQVNSPPCTNADTVSVNSEQRTLPA